MKGLFSGAEPMPPVFSALAALLLGAGAQIQAYLTCGEGVGRGMNWVWYFDARKHKDELWRWDDVVAALAKKPDGADLERLPVYVLDSFKLCKDYVRDHAGDGELEGWDSRRLAQEAFPWVASSS
ncbi:hypothetical protein SCP_0703080 [Sparassis crispa]|uniref:Uncharacterized protein n=1 Tax=Sparassis crispa TaxID=139825 RepID=A0A401GSA9_9APHY|nr:hypothetical protein SCP_0703080 [Sparassis crispa]GBE85122.1 hypothetical protein SCP_0703080 [Sparassis crispa]